MCGPRECPHRHTGHRARRCWSCPLQGVVPAQGNSTICLCSRPRKRSTLPFVGGLKPPARASEFRLCRDAPCVGVGVGRRRQLPPTAGLAIAKVGDRQRRHGRVVRSYERACARTPGTDADIAAHRPCMGPAAGVDRGTRIFMPPHEKAPGFEGRGRSAAKPRQGRNAAMVRVWRTCCTLSGVPIVAPAPFYAAGFRHWP